MGVAAYNRGTRMLRTQFDRETTARRVTVRRATKRHCEMCFAKLGVRRERGCAWHNGQWVDACDICQGHIARNPRVTRARSESNDEVWTDCPTPN